MDAALCSSAFAASYVGFALLALRQTPHHARVTAGVRREGPPAAARRRALGLGLFGLGLGLGACLMARGPSFGSLLWVLLLGASALGVMFTLTYRPRWLRPLARALGAGRRPPTGAP